MVQKKACFILNADGCGTTASGETDTTCYQGRTPMEAFLEALARSLQIHRDQLEALSASTKIPRTESIQVIRGVTEGHTPISEFQYRNEFKSLGCPQLARLEAIWGPT
jgi:hypothetical protein